MWRSFHRHHALNIVRHIAEHNLTHNVTFLSPTSRTEHSPPYRWTHSDTQYDALFTVITPNTHSHINVTYQCDVSYRNTLWHRTTVSVSLASTIVTIICRQSLSTPQTTSYDGKLHTPVMFMSSWMRSVHHHTLTQNVGVNSTDVQH